MTDYELELVLVVGGSKLPRPIDLDALQEDLEGEFETNGDQPGLYYYKEEDWMPVTFYEGDEDGASYIVRAKNHEILQQRNRETLEELVDIGVITQDEADDIELEVYNNVVQGNLNKDLKLPTVTLALQSYDDNQNPVGRVEYEPEQFPHVVYKGVNNPCIGLIFANGKMIVPGGETTEDCALTFQNIVDELADKFPSKFDEAEEVVVTS